MKLNRVYMFACFGVTVTASVVIGQLFTPTTVAAELLASLTFEQGDLKWSHAAKAPDGWIDLTNGVRYKFPDDPKEEWVPSELRGKPTPDYRDCVPYGYGTYGNVGDLVDGGVLTVPATNPSTGSQNVIMPGPETFGLLNLDRQGISSENRINDTKFYVARPNNSPTVNFNIPIPEATVTGTVRPKGAVARVFMRCGSCEEIK